MSHIALVDIQGFKPANDKFILKEIFISTYPENEELHAIINSPYSFHELSKIQQRQVQWLSRNYHGIKWSDGDMSLSKFLLMSQKLLKRKVVLCKGFEKMKWVESIFNGIVENIVNVEDYGCSIKLSENCNFTMCDRHINSLKPPHCALKNVMLLKQWYTENYFVCK